MRKPDGSLSECQHCFPVYGGGLEVHGVEGILQVSAWVYLGSFCFNKECLYVITVRVFCMYIYLHIIYMLTTLKYPHHYYCYHYCYLLLQAYKDCVTAVYFSGPTLFAPLINAATAIAASANCR